MREYFVHNEISLEEVQESFMHISVSLKRDLGKYFRKESLEAESIKELLLTLSCYWDYLNPGLLEFLVGRFGSEYNNSLLTTYLKKLKQFRSEVKLGEYVKSRPNNVNINADKIYKEITAIMGHNWEEKTLQDAEDYKNELADKCHIQRLLGRINVTHSSIALIFHVPRWFEVKKEKLEPFFREQNVRKVYLDDICFIDWTEQVGMTIVLPRHCNVSHYWQLPKRQVVYNSTHLGDYNLTCANCTIAIGIACRVRGTQHWLSVPLTIPNFRR